MNAHRPSKLVASVDSSPFCTVQLNTLSIFKIGEFARGPIHTVERTEDAWKLHLPDGAFETDNDNMLFAKILMTK